MGSGQKVGATRLRGTYCNESRTSEPFAKGNAELAPPKKTNSYRAIMMCNENLTRAGSMKCPRRGGGIKSQT